MDYYNGQENPNYKIIKIKHLNNYKNQYKHSSTDNILENKIGSTLHKIYNKFLVSPYLTRNNKYRNALYNINKAHDNYKNNNFQTKDEKQPKINNDLNNNILNNENEKKIHFAILDKNKYNINDRSQIFNEETKNQYQKENELELMKPKDKLDNVVLPKIINNKANYSNNNIIERPIEYNINYNKDFNDIYYTNNNNRLSLSYDFKNKREIEGKKYISPIIAKIAKNNYLANNPYSDKNEYLGPSSLKNNPILYPISTYKFDFNRYLRNYYINKFVQ